MGYRTYFYGDISFDKNNTKLVWLLKYIQNLSKKECKEHNENDEWIWYNAHLENIDFEEGIISSPDDEFKDYCETTLTLCWIIAKLDKTATGDLSWNGEESGDFGSIIIADGKISLSQPVMETKELKELLPPRKTEEKKITKLPEHNFLNLIKNKNLNEETLKNLLIVEAI